MLSSVLVVCILYTACVGALPLCTDGSYQIIPKADCKGYFLCAFGRPVEMPDCPPGSVFSRMAHVCVPVHSVYDDCSNGVKPLPVIPQPQPGVPVPGNRPGTQLPDPGMPLIPDAGPLTPEEQCAMYGGIFPHPDQCQAYYNCSQTEQPIYRVSELHYQECQYPQLFNTHTKQCDDFNNVKCGNRIEPKSACGYRRHQCPVAHCIPCNVRFPSCEGLSDGQQPHPVKTWSPYYVTCYKNRTMSEETCPRDEFGHAQLYHPQLNQCVSLDRIPQEHGGLMPDCVGKQDARLTDVFGRCGFYAYCSAGHYVGTLKCKSGEAFEPKVSQCVPENKACKPCGTTDC